MAIAPSSTFSKEQQDEGLAFERAQHTNLGCKMNLSLHQVPQEDWSQDAGHLYSTGQPVTCAVTGRTSLPCSDSEAGRLRTSSAEEVLVIERMECVRLLG
jgi:hypothetical protein